MRRTLPKRRFLALVAVPIVLLATLLISACDQVGSRAALVFINGVEPQSLDPLTLQAQLENPTPFFVDICAFVTTFPVHLATVQRFGEDWIKPEHIVNNGAFLLEEWKLNDRIRLKKNLAYWDRKNVSFNKI